MAKKQTGGNGRPNPRVEGTVNRPTSSEVEVEHAPEVSTPESTIVEIPADEDEVLTQADFEDLAHFEIPAESPKKRGRKKGTRNKTKVQAVSSQTTPFVISLVDVLGMTLAGDQGALNDTERTLLTMSLDEVSARYSEQVEKYAGYIYPVCGVLALGLWGRRVIQLRSANEQATRKEANQQPDFTGLTHTEPTPQPTNSQPNIFGDATLAEGVNRPF